VRLKRLLYRLKDAGSIVQYILRTKTAESEVPSSQTLELSQDLITLPGMVQVAFKLSQMLLLRCQLYVITMVLFRRITIILQKRTPIA